MNKQDQNELKENLTKLAKQNPQQEVSYKEIFTPNFMQKYTNFANIDFFLKALNLSDFTELDKSDQTTLNNFIKENTHFKTWQEMQQVGINNYLMSLF